MTERSCCAHAEEHDETIVAVVHAGRSMLCHVTISYDCTDQTYVVRINDETELDRLPDQDIAITVADMFLHGFTAGYVRGQDQDLPPDPLLTPHIHAFEPKLKPPYRLLDRRN